MINDNIDRAANKFDLWERKLLDLTARNSLLNLKINGSAVPLLVPSSGGIEDLIFEEKDYALVSRVKAVRKSEDGQQEEAAIPAGEYGIEDLAGIDESKDVLDDAMPFADEHGVDEHVGRQMGLGDHVAYDRGLTKSSGSDDHFCSRSL